MSGLACATCRKFFRVKKVGICFEEGMPVGPVQEDSGPESWRPYKLWMADLCECPGCGAQLVLTGTGQQPIAIQHERDFQRLREKFSPLFRVDDCGGKKP